MNLRGKYKGIKDWFISKSTIDKTFSFYGSKEDFIRKLNDINCQFDELKFQLTKFEDNEFIITDPVSVERDITDHIGYSLYGTITVISKDRLSIRLKSVPNYFIFLILILTIIVPLLVFIFVGLSGFIALFSLVICLIWFNWVSKLQFEILIQKVKKYFKLED